MKGNDLTDAKFLTFDVEYNQFALDRVSVDRAPVAALVFRSHVSHLQVPLLDLWSHNAKPRIIDNASVVVCQRNHGVVLPNDLYTRHQSVKSHEVIVLVLRAPLSSSSLSAAAAGWS
jgi:hypothetical protein